MNMSLLELYARTGLSLSGLGLNEAVLPKKEALIALELFARSKVLIVGGDLYEKNASNDFHSLYADWYYDGSNYIEGLEIAKEYISKFDDDSYVSFTLKESL